MNKRTLQTSSALAAVLGLGLFGLVGCGGGPGEEGNPVPENEAELLPPPDQPSLEGTGEPPAGTGGAPAGG